MTAINSEHQILGISIADHEHLRKAAIHEAAHLWMLQYMGGFGEIEIWRNPSSDASERAFLGRVRMYVLPSDIPIDAQTRKELKIPSTAEKRNCMVGMAGFLGELIEECGPLSRESTMFGFTVERAYCDGAVSASDYKLIEGYISESLAWRTFKLLRDSWDEVLEIADEAIISVLADESEEFGLTEG